ncbi:galectin-1-like [Antechinus flavipes]|uniref:galectin-1-like n=1 Tax=Antechinus flavipes TaxID=38775 RepID=UPI0022360CFA|nr:galectin-1-like [Antechinus flavipes]
MSQEIFVENMKLPIGSRVNILGRIQPNAKLFRINLGKDELDIGLHFNPRFKPHYPDNVIVCNNAKRGIWCQEVREKNSYFAPGDTVSISIFFDGKEFLINMPNNHQMTFPNRLDLEEIDFMAIYGDLDLKKVDFE